MSTAKGRLRILIVDDNPDDHALFQKAILRTCPGCEIEESDHPDDAFGKLRLRNSNELPQIIVTDGSFHGSDGPAFVKELRQRFPRIPVIILSAREDQESINRAYEAGASAYLIKPNDFESLVKKVGLLTRFLEQSALPK